MAGKRTTAVRALLAAAVGGPAVAGAMTLAAAPTAHAQSGLGFTFDLKNSNFGPTGTGPALDGPINFTCLNAGDTLTFVGNALDETTGFDGKAVSTFTCPQQLSGTEQQTYTTLDAISGKNGDTVQLAGVLIEANPLGARLGFVTQTTNGTVG